MGKKKVEHVTFDQSKKNRKSIPFQQTNRMEADKGKYKNGFAGSNKQASYMKKAPKG